MEQLVRTRVAEFALEDSHTLAEIEAAVREGTVNKWILPVDRLFTQCPKASVREDYQKALDNGNRLPVEAIWGWSSRYEAGQLRLYDSKGQFAGLYQYQEQEADLKPVKIFYEKE